MPTSGDTYTHTHPASGYPASAGWLGRLRLVPRLTAGGAAAVTLSGTAAGDDHLFTASAAATAGWVPGAYSITVWVERAGEVVTLATWQDTVAPNPRELAAGTDTRSLPRRTLDDLLAARAQWASTQGRVRRYKIGEREREFASAAELDAEIRFWEGQLAVELQAERLAQGLKPRNRILTRFTRPR